MTDAELSILLDRFLCLPAGAEVVEFKEPSRRFDYEQIGEYFSALSNEANLRGHGAAWLVFGMNDERQEDDYDFQPSLMSLTTFQGDVGAKVSHNLTFRQVYELQRAEGKNVFFFEIPPALPGIPTAWDGRCYTRNGEKVEVMGFDELETIRNQAHRRSFEEDIALGGQTSEQVLQLLDYNAIFRLFELPVPAVTADILDRLQQERFIERNDSHYGITNLGALLFARNLTAFPQLANKAIRVIFYEGTSRVKTTYKYIYWEGYALAFEELLPYLSSNLPGKHEVEEGSGATAPLYPEAALSELIANALIHQDFAVTSSSPMVEVFDNRIEISNPGRPLIDTNRFLDHTLQTRNKQLAGIMRRLNIGKELGIGADRVISECEEHQLPPPEFIVGENSTRAVLYSPNDFNKMDQQDKIRACYQHACLRYVSGDPISYHSLRERLNIAKVDFHIASRIIADTIAAGFIYPCDPTNKSRRFARYLPFWAS